MSTVTVNATLDASGVVAMLSGIKDEIAHCKDILLAGVGIQGLTGLLGSGSPIGSALTAIGAGFVGGYLSTQITADSAVASSLDSLDRTLQISNIRAQAIHDAAIYVAGQIAPTGDSASAAVRDEGAVVRDRLDVLSGRLAVSGQNIGGLLGAAADTINGELGVLANRIAESGHDLNGDIGGHLQDQEDTFATKTDAILGLLSSLQSTLAVLDTHTNASLPAIRDRLAGAGSNIGQVITGADTDLVNALSALSNRIAPAGQSLQNTISLSDVGGDTGQLHQLSAAISGAINFLTAAAGAIALVESIGLAGVRDRIAPADKSVWEIAARVAPEGYSLAGKLDYWGHRFRETWLWLFAKTWTISDPGDDITTLDAYFSHIQELTDTLADATASTTNIEVYGENGGQVVISRVGI